MSTSFFCEHHIQFESKLFDTMKSLDYPTRKKEKKNFPMKLNEVREADQ